MDFWIYENWTADDKAIIHIGRCSFCNHGEGIHKNIHGDAHGKWHGPFDTYENTKTIAVSLNRKRVADCSKCMPYNY